MGTIKQVIYTNMEELYERYKKKYGKKTIMLFPDNGVYVCIKEDAKTINELFHLVLVDENGKEYKGFCGFPMDKADKYLYTLDILSIEYVLFPEFIEQ